ncbi:MAG TPA: DUF2461 domain-containing protein [Candidatus Merdivicinus intestinavium]|nr:DUF2461 domain-containing protein [Candidatus Merdivicinus intestinavium]
MPLSPKSLDFLFENRLHDSREWFEEHKEQYRELVVRPMAELVQELTPAALEIDPEFTTEPRVDRTISRVRRDTRFSRDKSLYRDNVWLIFKRGKMHGTELPGVYLEVTGQGFSYGCGFYSASTRYMNCLRELVLKDDPAFRKAQRAFSAQNVFVMEGECYKRPRFPGQPEEKRQWLERRNICFSADSRDFDLLFSGRLGQKAAEDLLLLKPVYEFLLHVSLLAGGPEAE